MFDDDQTVVFFNGIDGEWHSLVEGTSTEECRQVGELIAEAPLRRRPAGTEAPPMEGLGFADTDLRTADDTDDI